MLIPPVYTSDLEYYKFQFKNNSPSDPDFGTSYFATTYGYFGYSAGRFSNANDNNGNPIPARAVDYLVSVAIKMNGSPIGSYGNTCTITTPGAFLSEIRAQYCGITLNNLTDQIVANRPPVYTPDLEYYKFQFKNNSPSDPDFGTSYFAIANGFLVILRGNFPMLVTIMVIPFRQGQ